MPDSFHDSALVNGGNSCLGLLNSNDDEFGMNMWSLPSGTQGGPGFQLFSSDADVTGSLVDVQHGSSVNCTSSMSGYGLAGDTGIGSASLLPETYTDRPNADINDSSVDNPLAFSGNDPSLQLFLPTRPSDTSVEAARDQPDVSNGVGTEDWISLRLGGDGGVHGDSAAANGLSSGQQVQTKDSALDSLADTANAVPHLHKVRSSGCCSSLCPLRSSPELQANLQLSASHTKADLNFFFASDAVLELMIQAEI